MGTSYPLGGIGVQVSDFGSVDLFGTEYGPGNFVPTVGAFPATGLDGVTAPAGLLLARAVAGVTLVPFVAAQIGTDETGIPVAILGSDVINPDPAVALDLRAIFTGQVKIEKLTHFLPATGFALVSAFATPEVIYDLLRSTGIFARATTDLAVLDNSS